MESQNVGRCHHPRRACTAADLQRLHQSAPPARGAQPRAHKKPGRHAPAINRESLILDHPIPHSAGHPEARATIGKKPTPLPAQAPSSGFSRHHPLRPLPGGHAIRPSSLARLSHPFIFLSSSLSRHSSRTPSRVPRSPPRQALPFTCPAEPPALQHPRRATKPTLGARYVALKRQFRPPASRNTPKPLRCHRLLWHNESSVFLIAPAAGFMPADGFTQAHCILHRVTIRPCQRPSLSRCWFFS